MNNAGDDIAIVQEQLAWWIMQGFTPREAGRALLPRTSRRHCRGWGAVLDLALLRWREMRAGEAA
jgi:hypothetical protein